MSRYASVCVALCLPLGLAACGGDKKSETSSSSPQTVTKTTTAPSTTPPSTTSSEKSSSGLSASQDAELKAGAECMVAVSATKVKGSQQFGKPGLIGKLPSGNTFALVFYGTDKGATQGEIAIEKEHPGLIAYHSSSDKILVMFRSKPSATDRGIGLKCIRQASEAD